MERASDKKMAARLHVIRSAESDKSGGDPSCLRKQLDDVCMVLFDRKCERKVKPLFYLLHAWPILPSSTHPVRRVFAVRRDL
jgi:hypothetical protein